MEAETLAIYAAILDVSRAMLAAAKSASWDELVAQEAAQQQLVGKLKTHLDTAPPRLTRDEPAKINALIQQILKLDEETRALVEHCAADLKESLAAIGVTKQLKNTYLRP